MSEETNDIRDRKKTRRGCLIVAGLICLLFGGLLMVLFQDAPPPDDAWMLPTCKAAPPGGNPLAIFCREIAKHPPEEYYKLLETTRGDFHKISSEDMKAYVRRNSLQTGLFDRLMQSDPATWMWPDIKESYPSPPDWPYLISCQSIASGLQRMRAELLIRDGNGPAATMEILKTIRFGHGMRCN